MKAQNLKHPCELCEESEGVWRNGGELGAVGSNAEECDRIVNENTGYYCDICWNEIANS